MYRVKAQWRRVEHAGRHVPLLILKPVGAKGGAAVLWIHGGGYMTGMKEMALFSRGMDLARRFGAVVVSPGYRLSWMEPYPAAAEDCYWALLYLKAHARELGAREEQIVVGGESAGGGLAAAVCMMARDRGEVRVAFQMPLYPMLDNLDTESSRDNHGRVWNTRKNHMGWRMYLRKDAKKDVSPYAAPARQRDWRGLPPAYTFVCQGEPFYRETLDFVDKLKENGIWARADVYPGNTHAFDLLRPWRDESKRARERCMEAFEYAQGHFMTPREEDV